MKLHKALVLLPMLSVAGLAAADDATSVMKKMAAGFDRAMMTKDVAWFDKISTPNFVEFGANGQKIDRKHSMDQMKQNFGMMTTVHIETQVLSAREKGGAIMATFRTTMTSKMKIPNQPAKGVMKGDMTYSERWVKEGGQWQIQWLKTEKQNMTMDGKPAGGM